MTIQDGVPIQAVLPAWMEPTEPMEVARLLAENGWEHNFAQPYDGLPMEKRELERKLRREGKRKWLGKYGRLARAWKCLQAKDVIV